MVCNPIQLENQINKWVVKNQNAQTQSGLTIKNGENIHI